MQVQFGTHADCLSKRLGMTGNDAEVTVWNVWQEQFSDDVLMADVYDISGSAASAYDTDQWIARLSAFIREAHAAERRLLGICFGHQLIHQALGGKVERDKSGWGGFIR